MYALISGYWYALINGIIMRTRGQHIKSVRRRRCVPDRECCRRSPYLQEVRSPTVAKAFNLHAKTETMTVLLRAFRCRSSLCLCRAVSHPGYFGKQYFCLCHLRNSRTQVDKFDAPINPLPSIRNSQNKQNPCAKA